MEVGISGYYSQRYVVDFAGLIQPEIAVQRSLHTDYEATALWVVQNYTPNDLVHYDDLFRQFEQTFVINHCMLVKHFPGADFVYDKDLSIYACES